LAAAARPCQRVRGHRCRIIRQIVWQPVPGQLAVRVEFPTNLQISNIPIFAGQNDPFAALPSRPVLDQEGRQKHDINANPHYLPFLQWRDRSLSDWFSDSTVALVLKANAEFASGDWSGQ
jgi:hypothetical protein